MLNELKPYAHWVLSKRPITWALRASWLAGLGKTVAFAATFGIALPAGQRFIANHEKFIFYGYLLTIGLLLLLDALRAMADWAKPKEGDGSDLVALVTSVGRIVEKKITRFRECAPGLRTSLTDPFAKITQPKDQFREIFCEIENLLRDRIQIADKDLDLTIMGKSPSGKSWEWVAQHGSNRHRTDPSKLMADGATSTAKIAISLGTNQFFASKHEAQRQGKYVAGPKDEPIRGSIYCYPVRVEVSHKRERCFVVTFATYGKQLCDTNSPEIATAIEFVLREYCRRIELELVLLAIKESYENMQNGNHGGSRARKQRRKSRKA